MNVAATSKRAVLCMADIAGRTRVLISSQSLSCVLPETEVGV